MTGAPTDATTQLIQLWKNAKYRCPVVVECWLTKKQKVDNGRRWCIRQGTHPLLPEFENIWLWDDAKPNDANASLKPRRLFVRDFSKRFDADVEYRRLLQLDGCDRVLLGDHYFDPSNSFDGPRCDFPSSGVDVDVTPVRLAGQEYKGLHPAPEDDVSRPPSGSAG